MDVPISYAVIGILTFIGIIVYWDRSERHLSPAEKYGGKFGLGDIVKLFSPLIGMYIVLTAIRSCY